MRSEEDRVRAGIFSKLLSESLRLVNETLDTKELILCFIDNRPLSVAQISRLLGYARQSTQTAADHLVKEGLCSYSENYFHRNSKLLNLTQKGEKALAQYNKNF